MKKNKILLLALSTMMLLGCTNNPLDSSINNSSSIESESSQETSSDTTTPTTSESSSNNETSVPESSLEPETSTPETSIPETSTPETSIPETSIPETSIPESSVKPSVPEVSLPDSSIEPSVPETSEPVPSIPDQPVEKIYEITINGDGNEGQNISKNAFITSSDFKLTDFSTAFCGSSKEIEAVKLGSSGKPGVLTFSSSRFYNIKSLVISAKPYSDDPDCKLEVSLSNGEREIKDITSSSYQKYNFTFNGTDNINSFEISSVTKKKRVYINKISFSASLIENQEPSKPETPDSTTPETSENSSSESSSHKPITPGTDIANPNNDPYQGNYYTKISSSSTGDKLIKELKELITKTHHPISYDALYDAYEDGDNRPGTNYVWDMYSDTNYRHHKDKAGQYKVEGDCYNREHSVPQSWFKGTSGPMKSDYFHVVPADGKVNGIRSSYPFGEVANPNKAKYTSRNGCMLGIDSRGQTVFEPCDEFKGDFARMYFYMITRYNDIVGKWGHVFTNSYPYLTSNYFDLYVKWALEDPVSEKEIIRNDAGQKHQGNRNPYVDHPSYFYRAFVK